MNNSPGAANWAKLLFLGVIWGASFMAVTVALQGFGPMSIAALRIFSAALCLLVLVYAMGIGLPSLRTRDGRIIWACALGMGFFTNALPFSLLSWGQTYVASGFAGVCMAVVPLFVLPLAHVLVPGEQMTLRRTISFLIGFAGVVVLIGLDAFRSAGTDFESLARLACLGASLCYAIGSIITRLCPQVNMLSLSAAALSCGALIIVPAALWQEGLPQNLPPRDALLAVAYLGLVPTALAQVLLVQVARSAGPAFLSTVNYQVPVWAVLFGALILNESLPPQLFAALALILGGLVLSRAPAHRQRP
ncbi:DMT family transporter [Rhodobacteraceae bacterium R_SAG1]|jgi:drug/metabolite transporter (DMT)-like permease|uniref:DMT family transporter n=1 Tax=Phaeobacter italicus TaxID=481446 RepID=UPI000619FCA3|nr:DMT family transporter [Phaeobacter italicus]MCI5101288.1 DMT family transporter [Phaeobacter italicus]MEC8573279.1 DMT family transporter [Pseudomonadota bacterium]NKX40004.1 DMT family transporter [Rhodobacteraceae bacterium R_SAG2]NKX72160.1 DMT family transporter [Rhodobacteraceae bacterium R_SAG1]